MLWEAGRLTLDLGRAVLAEDYGLKDATPHNVLFRGSEPVFVDALSFERRNPGDPLWKPCAQFIRSFLLPLRVHRRWGIPLADVFTTRRDGLEPEEVYRMCKPWERLHPSLLTLVSIPTWLSRRAWAGPSGHLPARSAGRHGKGPLHRRVGFPSHGPRAERAPTGGAAKIHLVGLHGRAQL